MTGPSRAGTSLPEALTALVTLFLVMQAALAVLAAGRRQAAGIVARIEGLEAERIVRSVLGEEVRAGSGPEDRASWGGDSVQLRAFRGAAVPCPDVLPAGEWRVRYAGLREPDPLKDSLLIPDERGGWRALALRERRVRSEGCEGSEGTPAEAWSVEPPVPPGPLVRLFERGSYHLSDEALRYRRGFGGRQPLTAPVLDPTASGMRLDVSGSLQVRIGIAAASTKARRPAAMATVRGREDGPP